MKKGKAKYLNFRIHGVKQELTATENGDIGSDGVGPGSL